MIAYQYDENTKVYKGEINCQKDPLESKLKGEDVYLLPANSTTIPPLEEKDGFDIVFDGEWKYQEKKKEPEPEPYIPTEKDKLQEELWKAQSELQGSDYKAIKHSEGYYTEEEYAPIKAERQALRDKINELQEKLANME